MAADQVLLEEKLHEYRSRGVSRVKLGLTDIDGVIRGKYVGLDKFGAVLEKGGGFCDCVFGWDVDDQLYDGGSYTGWHSGFPDTAFRLVTASERWLEEEGCPYFIGEFAGGGFAGEEQAPHPLCPRTRLRLLLDRLAGHGLELMSGFEYEFFVFAETAHSVRDKGYRNLTPLTPGNFGYSVLRASVEADRFTGLLDHAAGIGCELEGLHCETGPGVWEAALKVAPGVEAADRANLFKTFAKVFFQRRQCMATFMAKWSMDYPGQSGHYHVSLADADGNRFRDDAQEHGVSLLQRQALAGLTRFLPELLVLLAPTVNSYTRLVKGAWAPTAATWGLENRTAALRVIPGASAQRIECRVAGADANPYLVSAAVLAAMLAGIEEGLEPEEPVLGNAYDLQDSLPAAKQFPSSLRQATERFAASTLAADMLGREFAEHFAMTRLWECREYERNLNSWQLERYFEII